MEYIEQYPSDTDTLHYLKYAPKRIAFVEGCLTCIYSFSNQGFGC